jgi:hypothetical protein
MTREPFPTDFSQLATEDVFSGLIERARGGREAREVEEGEFDRCYAICDYQATNGGPADDSVGAAEGAERDTLILEWLGVGVDVCFSVGVVV